MRRYYIAEQGKNTGGKWSKKMAALNASTFDVFQVFRLALLSND